MARKQGSKDKTKRKNAILRGLGYTALTANPVSGIYLTHRDLKSTGKKRTVGGFAKTGAISSTLGSTTGTALNLIAAKKMGVPLGGKKGVASSLAGGAVGGAVGGAITGAGSYYVRRAFAKDKKKFDKGY